MLTFRIVACLDVKDGRVVKGVSFSDLQDIGDPAACAKRYQEQGIDELVFLDISATAQGRAANRACVAKVRKQLSIPLAVGGGIRSIEDAAAMLTAGADKVSVNTAAIADPALVRRMAARFGSQCVVVAIDARACQSGSGYELLSHAGTTVVPKDPIAWAQEVAELGAGEILLTSWDRDGTGLGYDEKLLSQICSKVRIPVIASGGAKRADHVVQAAKHGASAALVASILHHRQVQVADLKLALAAAKVPVRT